VSEEDVRSAEAGTGLGTIGAEDGVDEDAARLRSWYESVTGVPPTREETIGLLGRRTQAEIGLSRRERTQRVFKILSIVRKYDILHGLTPTTMRQMLEELGPTFVKAGQILSMRSEILPESFCKELGKLRTEVEPMPRDVVLETLRAEYSIPIEEIFDAIDDVPLGSASVAQVHKARLVTGELVAVKVQRPNVRAIMFQDIDIIRSIARRAKKVMGSEQFLDINSVIEELWQSFREETDFLVEARSLEEFRRNNADCAFVTCPKPYMGLCTRHVVVMDYVDGVPVSHDAELRALGYDPEEIGVKMVDNYTGQVLDDGFFHADPHPGNVMVADQKIVYIDLGIMGRLSAHDRAALSDMVFAVGDMDTPRLKDGLLRFSVQTDPLSIDHARLLADLDAIVQEYGTTNLADLNISRFLNAIVTLARRSGIELPGSVTMLGRSLVTLEGTVDGLLADQSIVELISRHVAQSSSLASTGKQEVQTLARETRLAAHGLLGAASQASLAMNMLTRGQLHVNMDVAGTDSPIADFSRAMDRLTLGIVAAGLFIGSSVIYYSKMRPRLFDIPVIGFVGFIAATVLAIWLFRDILRHRK